MIPSKWSSSDPTTTCDLLKELFPFTVVVDREGRVIDRGRLAERTLPQLRLRERLLDHFEYLTPDPVYELGQSSWHSQRPVTMALRVPPQTPMKGQLFFDGKDSLYLLWWPVVSNPDALRRLGVRLLDLPAHHNLVDMLMLVRNAEISVEDANMLLTSAREKQRELEETNKKLIGESELIRARRAAEAANEAKTRFLSHMSHELRTPMNAIVGYTETLLGGYSGKVDSEAENALKRIRVNARHLLDLVNKVLDLSVIESGYLELHCEPYDLREIIEDVLTIATPLAESRNLSLQCEIGSSLPEGMGDRMRLAEVLINLLHNAIKFTERGFVKLAVESPDQSNFVIRVSDSGKGIAPENILKIFKDFSKISLPGEMEAGAGLGLAIVDQIVSKHGGTIEVESQVGRGTCFTVKLPARASMIGAKAS